MDESLRNLWPVDWTGCQRTRFTCTLASQLGHAIGQRIGEALDILMRYRRNFDSAKVTAETATVFLQVPLTVVGLLAWLEAGQPCLDRSQFEKQMKMTMFDPEEKAFWHLKCKANEERSSSNRFFTQSNWLLALHAHRFSATLDDTCNRALSQIPPEILRSKLWQGITRACAAHTHGTEETYQI